MEKRKLEAQETTRVVTHNNFIKGCGMENASLKATKLLYIAIAQCRKTDNKFYEYSLKIKEFADLMGIKASNVYTEADEITDELVKAFIRAEKPGKYEPEKKGWKKYPLFSECEYDSDTGEITFQLNEKMTDFLLLVGRDFSQPLLEDFLHMKSVFSIKTWHLLQLYMRSLKPALAVKGHEYEYYISVDELREVTGTQDKYKKFNDFRKLWEKALQEIESCAGVKFEYKDDKKGKKVVGFKCKVIPKFAISEEEAAKLEERFKNKQNEQNPMN